MPLSHCHVCGDSRCHARSGVLRLFARRFATAPSMRPVVRTCKVCHDSNAMMTCHHCDRVLLYECLRAVLADDARAETRDIRVCSVECCEALGHMDHLVVHWRYQAQRERGAA